MCVLQAGEDHVEIAASLVGGKAAQAVVAAEFDDDHRWMEREDIWEAGDGIFRGSSAGSLVVDLPDVTGLIELTLQGIAVGLAGLQSVTGGDAVSKADEHWTRGG